MKWKVNKYIRIFSVLSVNTFTLHHFVLCIWKAYDAMFSEKIAASTYVLKAIKLIQ